MKSYAKYLLFLLAAWMLPGACLQAQIKVVDFAGLKPYLHQKNDTTYVVNFWATWCKPCVEEMPFFERLERETAGKAVRIVLVSLDFKSQIDKKLVPFIKSNKLKPEVIVLSDPDANTWIPEVDPDWGGAIPVTLIYRNGKRQFKDGPFDTYEELKQLVDHL